MTSSNDIKIEVKSETKESKMNIVNSKPFTNIKDIKILDLQMLNSFKLDSTNVLSKIEEMKNIIDVIDEVDESTTILTKIKNPTPIALNQKTRVVYIPDKYIDLY